MNVVATKVVRLDRLATFANTNFDRPSGKEFDMPYAIEIEQHADELDSDRFAIRLAHCTPSGHVETICRSNMLPRELVEEKFKLIENSVAGSGPGIELLGVAAWYWLLSSGDGAIRDLAVKIAIEAWDAWTLTMAILDGSKARDKFQHADFICPGVSSNQSALCLSMKDHDHSIWLKRATVRRGRYTSIISRWTFVKMYTGANNFSHEEKHTVSQSSDTNEPPASFEVIEKARKYPFNPQ